MRPPPYPSPPDAKRLLGQHPLGFKLGDFRSDQGPGVCHRRPSEPTLDLEGVHPGAVRFSADVLPLSLRRRLDDLIVQALMRAFGMVMLNIFSNKIPEMAFTKDQHAVQVLALDTPNESLDQRIQVGSHGQGFDGINTRIFEYPPELPGKNRIPVMDQVLLILQKAGDGVGQVAGQLLHLLAVGLLGNTHDFYFTGRIVDRDKDIVAGQSFQMQILTDSSAF